MTLLLRGICSVCAFVVGLVVGGSARNPVRRRQEGMDAMTDPTRQSEQAHYDPRHPHEPEIVPQLDAEGRCLICGLLVQLDAARRQADQLQEALRLVGPLVATTRCLKRPDSKLDHDPGPCGTCAPCLAKRGIFGADWRDS